MYMYIYIYVHYIGLTSRVGHAASGPHAWVLALRKWSELYPSREFRCFRGTGGRFLAACQRDRFSCYPGIYIHMYIYIYIYIYI